MSFNLWKMSAHFSQNTLCNIWHQPFFYLDNHRLIPNHIFFFLITAFPSLKKTSNSVYKFSLFLVMRAILWLLITSYIRSKFWTSVHRPLPICTNLPAFPFSSQRIFFPDLRQTCFSYSRWTFILELNVILFLIQLSVVFYYLKVPGIPMPPRCSFQ